MHIGGSVTDATESRSGYDQAGAVESQTVVVAATPPYQSREHRGRGMGPPCCYENKHSQSEWCSFQNQKW